MAITSTRPYRRRNFFVKHWFQAGFALYPLLFLTVFLGVGSVYLERQVRETLEFYLYLPHSGLANPWEVMGPAVLRVAVAGGGAFLVALGVWGWRRFARLHRDLEALTAWLSGVVKGGRSLTLPALSDAEVRLLGVGLEAAARRFEAWDRDVEAHLASLRAAMGEAQACPDPELSGRVAAARDLLRGLSGELSRLRLEEDLS